MSLSFLPVADDNCHQFQFKGVKSAADEWAKKGEKLRKRNDVNL
jgi:hypothetical protein